MAVTPAATVVRATSSRNVDARPAPPRGEAKDRDQSEKREDRRLARQVEIEDDPEPEENRQPEEAATGFHLALERRSGTGAGEIQRAASARTRDERRGAPTEARARESPRPLRPSRPTARDRRHSSAAPRAASRTSRPGRASGRRRLRLSARQAFGEAIAQADRAVEDQLPGGEFADRRNSPGARTGPAPQALPPAIAGSSRQPFKTSSELGLRSAAKSPAFGSGRVNSGLYSRTSAGIGVRRRHPVQRRLDLAPVGRIVAAAGRRIVGAAQLDHLAGRILHRLAAGDEIGVAQPHFLARARGGRISSAGSP